MQDIWLRIEAEFRRQAPEEIWCLRDGATEEQIAALESLIGRRLPDDFRQSCAIHDGVEGSSVPTGSALSSFDVLFDVDSIARELTLWRTLARGGDARWDDGWIPIIGEGTGDHLCLDLTPPAGGSPGQVFDFGHEYGPGQVLFPDFRSYLAHYAANLESGAIRFDGEEWVWVSGPAS